MLSYEFKLAEVWPLTPSFMGRTPGCYARLSSRPSSTLVRKSIDHIPPGLFSEFLGLGDGGFKSPPP